MAKINSARVLPLIVLAAFAVSTSNAQAAPAAGNIAGGNAVTPAAAPSPTELADTAPNPPKVTCNGDQLTIVANNSTLGSVLAAVRACAGVKIDVPDGLGGSRVFDRIGPGPAREVLTTLFEAMNFNYVIGSSDANPDKIDSVLLIARGGDTPSGNNSDSSAVDRPDSVLRRAWMQTRQNRAASLQDDNEAAVSAAPVEQPAVPQPDTSSMPISSPTADATPARVEPPAASGVDTSANKSTADQITSMQQLFEQRRQMMEKLNASKPQQP